MCDLLDEGLVNYLLDTQDFDLSEPKRFRISAGSYSKPFNKGAFVNKLDYVILAALEVNVNFNVNVVVGAGVIISGGIRIQHQVQSVQL